MASCKSHIHQPGFEGYQLHMPGPDATDPRVLRRLLRAKDRIDAASHEAWTITKLASVSGISPAHFARSFRDAFGAPPHRYLLTRRVERANALLRDTDLSVTEIALAVGWNSLGTFTRTFRDVTGFSPSEARKCQKTNPQALEQVPHCFVSAAHRPDLRIAVLEKRRLAGHPTAARKKGRSYD